MRRRGRELLVQFGQLWRRGSQHHQVSALRPMPERPVLVHSVGLLRFLFLAPPDFSVKPLLDYLFQTTFLYELVPAQESADGGRVVAINQC